ncbi:MAG: OsmC family protein [Gammaproteobacteria bacterium]
MRIVLHAGEDLEFSQFEAPDLTLEPEHPRLRYGPMQMFATSLALCTYSVLAVYAETIDTPVEDLSMRVRWSYAQQPNRIDRIDMDIQWPALPPARLQAARLAASHCTLHHTLENPPAIATRVATG